MGKTVVPILSAVLIPLVGRKKIGTIMLWFRDTSTVALRLWMVVGLALALVRCLPQSGGIKYLQSMIRR